MPAIFVANAGSQNRVAFLDMITASAGIMEVTGGWGET
jgi:hypothetical protein